jgi:hypothetical protein
MKIYLSYSLSSTDLYIAGLLTHQAQSKGISVETSQQHANSADWGTLITHPIISSQAVVAIVSRDSQNTVSVQQELAFARMHVKPVLALVESGSYFQTSTSGIQFVEFDRRNLNPALTRISLILEGQKNQQTATWLVAGGLALLALYLIAQEK